MKTTVQMVSSLAFIVTRSRTSLSVQLVPDKDGFRVIALESSGKTISGVLDSHAHKDLGWFHQFFAACEVAGAYVDKWAGKASKKKCPCKTIKT